MKKQQFLALFQDLIGPQKAWPIEIRCLLFGKKHLKNHERFKCVVFLLGNGINPEIITEFFMKHFVLDKEAQRQLAFIINKYPTSNWMSWNVYLNKSI